MIKIRYVEFEDQTFWYRLDKHLPQQEFRKKVENKEGYVLLNDDKAIGLLRYNFFWDNIPFCTMLLIDKNFQNKGYGKKMMEFWENEMKLQGHKIVLTSTQVDEKAQHFYRKLGYQDCGGLLINDGDFKQPMELILRKTI
ncbi:MAG: GNAT family N-acetyltransferase [Bacilli bacterium]|nr:GNAT family N-acetyltransferase [Staphylococcus sp.]